jgi:hypothetical protein
MIIVDQEFLTDSQFNPCRETDQLVGKFDYPKN